MPSPAVLDTPPQSGSAFPAGIDPVRFEVLRNALLAITEEMGATLRQAAYSTNIKTRGDFSCAFFDRELRTIAQRRTARCFGPVPRRQFYGKILHGR